MREDDIINLLQKLFKTPEGYLGIGDDCAAFPKAEGGYFLVSTDSLVEGTHFIGEKISPEDLGYKLVMVNLSDIAAMGGRPHSVYISLALPPLYPHVERFFSGVHEALRETGALLLGGDVVRSPGPLFLNISALGEAEMIKTRSGGVPGDLLCVTDTLGDSAGGLRQLERGDGVSLIPKQNRPKAHLKEGQLLAQLKEVHALMDISDGLHIDTKRLAKASGCGAVIDLNRIPLSQELKDYAGSQALSLAAGGGEDYCLLAAIDPQADLPSFVYPVGTLTEKVGALDYVRSGKPVEITLHPFEHFL